MRPGDDELKEDLHLYIRTGETRENAHDCPSIAGPRDREAKDLEERRKMREKRQASSGQRVCVFTSEHDRQAGE